MNIIEELREAKALDLLSQWNHKRIKRNYHKALDLLSQWNHLNYNNLCTFLHVLASTFYKLLKDKMNWSNMMR